MGKKRSRKRPTFSAETLQLRPAAVRPTKLRKKSYDSLTVFVPGTLASLGIEPQPPWYSNDSDTLFTYLMESVFRGQATHVHVWNTLPFHLARVNAAKDLLTTLSRLSIGVLRIIGHSHGANVASMATRDDLIAGVPGLKVDTLVLLSPAVGHRGMYSEYYPEMSNVGDMNASESNRRFFTFHPPRDTILHIEWAHDYQGTRMKKHETLRPSISNNADHWASTYVNVWTKPSNRLTDLIDTP